MALCASYSLERMLRARSSCLYEDNGSTVLKVGKESTRPVTLEISVSYKPQLTHAETNTRQPNRRPLRIHCQIY